MPGRLLHVWAGFRSRQGFLGHNRLFCVTIGVLCITTWFSSFIQFPCHDIVLPFHDNVFLLYRDNVATEVSLSLPRWSRQEVMCFNRFGLGQGFYVTTECFYVTTEFGQGQGILCHDRVFLCRDRVLSWLRDFMSRQSIFMS